ncbi:hypothetical protein SeMB42_g01247 [Synchytrium endobioticum]|uniref:F-box domain-containing protein n=1 Tax=Synchytrium endobioticum TaxID=286115 RepID=A0A507DM60_9FUNG|nr:hypothetical protein SeLEV6574_g00693 [Synchytrium endobioticum]TPX52673.1 hypothetical protein SeMB42_g01247 [Synchytrium endobioticum]
MPSLSELPEEILSGIMVRVQHPYHFSCTSSLFYRLSLDLRVRAAWLFHHPTAIYHKSLIPVCLTSKSIPPVPTTWPILLLRERTIYHFIRLYNTSSISRLSHFDKCAIAVIWKMALENLWEYIIAAILQGCRTSTVINRPRDYIAGVFLSRTSSSAILRIATLLKEGSQSGQALTLSEMENIICDGVPSNALLLLSFMGPEYHEWILERAFHLRRMDVVRMLLDFMDTQKGSDSPGTARAERLRVTFEDLAV